MKKNIFFEDVFRPQNTSMDFDGVPGGDEMANNSPVSIGIADEWSIMFWMKRSSDSPGLTSARSFFTMKKTGNINRIECISIGNLAGDPLAISLNDSDGVEFRRVRYFSNFPYDVWFQAIFSWDGTDVVAYDNGVVAAPTLATNSPGTMTDTTRPVLIGANTPMVGGHWIGKMHSIAIWNTLITSSVATEFFNEGEGNTFDLSKASFSENLQHWWRLGQVVADLGRDTGIGFPLIDVNKDSVNIDESDISDDAPPEGIFLAQTTSIEFNGVDEEMANTTNQDLGFGNDFSIMFWFRRRSDTPGLDDILNILQLSGATSANRVIVRTRGDLSNDPFEITLRDESAANHKVFQWNAPTFFPYDTWHQVIMTWDGSATQTLLVYENGVQQDTSTGVTNLDRDMANTDRAIIIANGPAVSRQFSGFIHSMAIWDVVVDSAVTELYNSGVASTFDVSKASFATDLQHWWRLGKDSSDLGKDSGIGSPLIDVDTNSVNIDSNDIDSESPP